MATIQRVKQARKGQGQCQQCGEEILKGDAYKHLRLNRFTFRQVRCASCPDWSGSELISNEKLRALYAAQENATRAIEDASDEADLAEALEAFVGELREVASMCEESASNLSEYAFTQEKAEAFEQAASDLEGVVNNVEDVAFDDFATWVEENDYTYNDKAGEYEDSEHTRNYSEDELKDEWLEEQRGRAREVIDVEVELP